MTDQSNAPISGRWGIPKPFDHTTIPNFVLENYPAFGVTNIQMMLIIHLASFRYDSDKTQGARPSIKTLAELMNLSYKSVLTHLQKLHADGHVIIHGGQETGRPSEYDFSPLTMKCLELAKQGGMKKDSHPRSKKRFRGIRYQGMKKNSHKEEALKQEKKKKEQNGQPPSFLSGDSPSLITDTESSESKKATQPKGQKEKGLAPAAPISSNEPAPIWQLTDRPPELEGVRLSKPFLASLPPYWDWACIYIYLRWLNHTTPSKAIYDNKKEEAEAIYQVLSQKLNLPPSVTAIGDFVTWYRSQDWIVKKANEKYMGDVSQINLPLAANVGKHLGDWLASRQAKPSTPVYVAPEVNPYERQQAGVRVGVSHG